MGKFCLGLLVLLVLILLVSGCASCKQFEFHNDGDDRQLCIQRRF